MGGGNVAVDVALTARRLGNAEVHMVCLEKRDEMPASSWEIEQSIEEGIKIHTSWGPREITGRERDVSRPRVQAVHRRLRRDGAVQPHLQRRHQEDFDADMVILAIGQSPETAFLKDLPESNAGRQAGSWRTPCRSPRRFPGVFAGGDIVTGPKMAIDAVSQGQEAAESIRRFLEGRDLKEGRCAKETELVVEVPDRHRAARPGRRSPPSPSTRERASRRSSWSSTR